MAGWTTPAAAIYTRRQSGRNTLNSSEWFASQSCQCACLSTVVHPFSAPDILHWCPVVAAAAAAPDLNRLYCTPSACLLCQRNYDLSYIHVSDL